MSVNWKWKEGSILYNVDETTPPKEIFKAVCDEIADYYLPKGWRYARSRPKLTYDDKKVKLEIAFWSSGSNMAGSYTNLEIIPSFRDLEYKKALNDKGIKSDGYILGLGVFQERSEDVPKGIKRVKTILGDIHDNEYGHEGIGVLAFNHNVNVYGLTESNFLKIIDFIESKIVVWIEGINEIEKMKLYTEKSIDFQFLPEAKDNFLKYIEFKFPDKVSEVEEILNK
ncbi:MAG: hypothetical protein ACON5F_14050 [Jejuia sp.]